MAASKRARARARAVEVKHFASWPDLREELTNPAYRGWGFRGHANAEWKLYSSLSRRLNDFGVHPEAWPEQEARCLRIFIRKAHLFLAHVPPETDQFQWLALLQHHGGPTRLLDFTWSPFVALYFALESALTDAAVWALDFRQIWKAMPKRVGLSPRRLNECDLRESNAYWRYYHPNTKAFVYQGEPQVMNQRLIAQSGTFAVPGVLDRPLEAVLEEYRWPTPLAVKLTIETKRVRDAAMQFLYQMNMTDATLFPGLDGLARSTAYELEFHWAFDPKNGRAT
jgi:hypothetical protein